jgi:predicted nucleic acid-binding Zn ribbon protein
MSFQPLNGIFNTLEQTQNGWRSRQQFKALLACWPQVVGQAVAAQTRPVALQRGTLIVATASAAWAQTLTFERSHLLRKLQQRLGKRLSADDLLDIRFSTAQWAAPRSVHPNADQLWEQHPSFVPPVSDAPMSTAPPIEPQTAFQQWASAMQARSRNLPLCPQCQCPTPQGELDRWSMCSLCAPKHYWSRSPQAPRD